MDALVHHDEQLMDMHGEGILEGGYTRATRLPASDGKDKPAKAPKIPKAAAKKAAAAKPGGGVAGQAKSAPARRANGKQPDQ
ncbi:unnamed protein product [Cladocopium goreaui]|uniref:Uncharacterized protein n=1 Tax=Cladocopium goreaui TaxID=2562237 RepID=A0A9P1C1P5_9DINO|nr:unnamed protein product [Cladocopium goreaui]CAI3987758.1 unnamed protein product [Cladocopium goreaui]